jgi:hypothetical protein
MQVQDSEQKQELYIKLSSSSFQPNASYIDGSASSLAGTEKGIGAASLAETGTVLVGVTTTAGGVKLTLVGGELLMDLARVSKTCDGAGSLLSGDATADFDGVAKIFLRTLSDEKVLVFGAFDGVSAMLACAGFRAVELRWPVAGTIAAALAPEEGMQKSLEGGAFAEDSLTSGW